MRVLFAGSQSRIQGRPDAMPAYQLERIFPSLKFDQPVECVAMPGKGGWMWVVELRGAIHAIQAHNAEPTLHSVVRLKETTPGVAEAYGRPFFRDLNKTPKSRFAMSWVEVPRMEPASPDSRWIFQTHPDY